LFMVFMLVFVASGISACRKGVTEPVPAKVAAVPAVIGPGPAVGATAPTRIIDGLPAGTPDPLIPPDIRNQPMTVTYSFKAIGDEAVFEQVRAGLTKTDGVASVQKVDAGVQVVFEMSKLSSDRVRGLIAGIAGDAEFVRPNQCAKCVGNPACSCYDAAADVNSQVPPPVCDCIGKEGCPCAPR
jgi:hypothetical protein